MMTGATEKWELPTGEGFLVLRIPWEELRLVSALPKDIFILGALPPDPWRRQVGPPLCYLLLTHPYFVRVPARGEYKIADLEDVLEQYRTIAARVKEL